jgi:hypothetical protein
MVSMSKLPQDYVAPSVPESRRPIARASHLNLARIALLTACLMTFIQAGVEFFTAESQFETLVSNELQRLGGLFRVDQGRIRNARDRYVRNARMSAMVSAGLGITMLIFTWLLPRFPMFCSLSGLILFLGATISVAYLTWNGPDVVTMISRNWRSLAWESGIAVSLIMGVQAAVLHQREWTKRANEIMEKLNQMAMA